MKDIRWNKIMLREFRSLVCLTDDEDRILDGWANGNSNFLDDGDAVDGKTVSYYRNIARKS